MGQSQAVPMGSHEGTTPFNVWTPSLNHRLHEASGLVFLRCDRRTMTYALNLIIPSFVGTNYRRLKHCFAVNFNSRNGK